MKNLLLKLMARPNIFSLLLLVFFLILAWGSIEIYETQYKGDGVYEESYLDVYGTITRTGKRDLQGRWQGKVVTEFIALNTEDNHIEEVNYVDGLRSGRSKEIYPNGETRELNYSNGRLNEDPLKVTSTGYNELAENFPFMIFAFNGLGFDDTYVERYIDSIEYVLGTYIFDFEDFDYNFDNAATAVSQVVFDTIDQVREDLAAWDGIYPYKSDEFRLAVLDYFIDGENSLYDIITSTYPGYLAFMNLQEVSNTDFEQFCGQFEDSLATYADLDVDDPLFSDSVDTRIYNIIYSFNYTKKAAASVESFGTVQNKNLNITELRKALREHKASTWAATPEDIGAIILDRMVAEYDQADFVRNAVRYAYMANNGILALPYVATEFVSHNSATSVNLNGYIIDDGGAIITSCGIAWGTKFNPTTDNNKLELLQPAYEFGFELDGLTEGTTYYARTYATNSVGTSYGNCIAFKAEEIINSIDEPENTEDLSIYPNPSNGTATLTFKVNNTGAVTVNIYDLKGAIVYTKNLGIRMTGENTLPIQAEYLKNGLYTCQVIINTTRRSVRFVVQK